MFVDKELVVIAFVPRSGSNYLCDMLRRTGLVDPLEYYYPYEFKARREAWDQLEGGDRIDSQLVDTEQRWFEYVASNGAVKITWPSYQIMMKEAGDAMNNVDCKYIYLRRHDKLLQAASWLRAEQSGIWTCLDTDNKGYCYNRDLIEHKIIDIVDHEARWNIYLEDKPHLDLFYEDLNYDVVKKVENFINRSRPYDYWDTNKKIMTQYTILRDAETERWIGHFLGN